MLILKTKSHRGLTSLFIALSLSLSFLASCSASETPAPSTKAETAKTEAIKETAKEVAKTAVDELENTVATEEVNAVQAEQKSTDASESSSSNDSNVSMVNKAATFNEGSDYITKFPNETPAKPVLVEFFSYMCPHCYNFEGTMTRWKKQKPDSVELIRIPVAFGRGRWRLAAQSYYIAEELNIVEKFSPAMFRRIHVEKKPPSKESDLEKLFATLGISSKKFKTAASSFNVDSKMRKADFLAKKYQVSGVPYFLVNYKYEIGKASYESEASLFNLFNNLPAKDF